MIRCFTNGYPHGRNLSHCFFCGGRDSLAKRARWIRNDQRRVRVVTENSRCRSTDLATEESPVLLPFIILRGNIGTIIIIFGVHRGTKVPPTRISGMWRWWLQ